MLLLLGDQTCPQLLEPRLPAELVHLRDLPKDILVILQIMVNDYQVQFKVLTSLNRSQLLLKLGFLLFKTLDPLFHLINFSRVLPVSFIKLVPSIESLIKMLRNFSILLKQGVPVVHSLIQSMRLQERPIGNILQSQNMICQIS